MKDSSTTAPWFKHNIYVTAFMVGTVYHQCCRIWGHSRLWRELHPRRHRVSWWPLFDSPKHQGSLTAWAGPAGWWFQPPITRGDLSKHTTVPPKTRTTGSKDLRGIINNAYPRDLEVFPYLFLRTNPTHIRWHSVDYVNVIYIYRYICVYIYTHTVYVCVSYIYIYMYTCI